MENKLSIEFTEYTTILRKKTSLIIENTQKIWYDEKEVKGFHWKPILKIIQQEEMI